MDKINSLSIVLPAYNEEKNIGYVLNQVLDFALKEISDFEIIVVNDGSTDNTLNQIDTFKLNSDVDIKVKTHPKNLGYGAALRSGFSLAEKKYVFFTDSDRQFDIKEITKLFTYINEYPIVAGFREKRADNFSRGVCGFLWTKLTNIFLRNKAKDINCAFKLFRKEVLDSISLVTTGAMINAEIFYKVSKKGFKIMEVPVSHYPRIEGAQTGLKPVVFLKAFVELFKIVFSK